MNFHWLKCKWAPWSEPIRQEMLHLDTWTNAKTSYNRWVQERHCLICNKIERKQIIVEKVE